MDASQLLLFIAAGLLLNLTPGPDVLYIVTNALRSGARAGVVAALGITAGCFVHIFAAALGVSALMAASSTAFSILKWAGAAYLVYLGGRMLLARAPVAQAVDATTLIAACARITSASGLKRIFFLGFWTNALNPKVALFFLAFSLSCRSSSRRTWPTSRWRFCCSVCCSTSTACGSMSAGRRRRRGCPGVFTW